MLRELLHMGQMVQSHALHFFHLASPDLLLGFDADPAIRNVVGLIQKDPAFAVKGVTFRKFGQEIIKMLGDKKVHPNYAVPGGVNKALPIEERDKILGQIDEMMGYAQVGLDIIKGWLADNQDVAEKCGKFKSGYMGLVDKCDSLELYDGLVKLDSKDGEVYERFNGKDYLDYIGEHTLDYSYLKSTFYKRLGYPDGVYRVGTD